MGKKEVCMQEQRLNLSYLWWKNVKDTVLVYIRKLRESTVDQNFRWK